LVLLSMNPPPPRSTLFPYTTLFRSDDLSLAGDQAWQRRLGAVQRAVEVDRHDPLEHFQAGVGHTAAMGDAGVVDQHVDAAEAVHYQRNGLLYRRRIRYVAAQAQRISVVPARQVLNQGIVC